MNFGFTIRLDWMSALERRRSQNLFVFGSQQDGNIEFKIIDNGWTCEIGKPQLRKSLIACYTRAMKG